MLRDHVSNAAAGSRLPSTRALVAEHHVSPVTVQKALRRLVEEGLVESRPGAGTFVRPRPDVRPADHGWQTTALGPARAVGRGTPVALREVSPDVIALHSGYPDRSLLPERLVRSALARAARGGRALDRAPVAGHPDLRAWFAHELAALCAGGVTSPDATDVVVLPGSQGGLSSVFRSLAGPGRPVIMESPTYWGALSAAGHAGVEVVPVRSAASGPDPADLDRVLAETGARVVYAQPTYANPTGAQWSPERSREVLEVVRGRGAFLVEDDWAHDFGITTSPAPLAGLDDTGHVVYLRSLTKSMSPAVRVAGLVARGPARERILADRTAETLYVSGVLQAAALDVVTQPAWRTHLRGLREQLRVRRDALAAALRDHAPSVTVDGLPPGGLNLWARLPDGVEANAVAEACERQGVAVAAGDAWFPTEPTAGYLRLSHAGPRPEAYAEAARVIARAVDEATPAH